MENKHSLELFNVSKTFSTGNRTETVIQAATARFQQGVSYALIGASGSGKSTLLHLLGGLETPTAGTVLFDGTDFTQFSKNQKETILRKNIGFMFQNHFLIKELPVIENVMLPAFLVGTSQQDAYTRAKDLLETIGLGAYLHAYPAHISGGQAQRVALARALMNKPAFILADEPTGNLDATTAREVISLLMQAVRTWGAGIIVCSHDANLYASVDSVLQVANKTLSHVT